MYGVQSAITPGVYLMLELFANSWDSQELVIKSAPITLSMHTYVLFHLPLTRIRWGFDLISPKMPWIREISSVIVNNRAKMYSPKLYRSNPHLCQWGGG